MMSVDCLGTDDSPAGDSSGKAERIRSAWAETMFLHMRERRYGISPCKECGKEGELDAQWQAVGWRLKREAED